MTDQPPRSKSLPQIPDALRKELEQAVKQACSDFGVENVDQLLKIRRELPPLQKHIFEQVISGKLNIDSIGLLARAILKIEEHKNGGAIDYASTGVESAIARMRAKNPRRNRGDSSELIDVAERNKKIVEYAQRAGYKSAINGEKDTIIDNIESIFALGKSQIRRVLKKAGITRGKKSKS